MTSAKLQSVEGLADTSDQTSPWPLGDVVERVSPPLAKDEERTACIAINPPGFHVRHPPEPYKLDTFITSNDDLFQTIHMGPAVVEAGKWRLVISGLVERPFSISLDQLLRFEQTSVTSFHECYGSPVKPPVDNVWRIGNVTWTGVRLSSLLELARPLPQASFVWSDGLDSGGFAAIEGIDRYQKDLPLDKALQPEVLVAWQINGQPLDKNRGGPVRLVVPGWFGTNSVKWLCRISLANERASGHFTTTWYNEVDPRYEDGRKRPVWNVESNSIITKPAPNTVASTTDVLVEGWAWGCDEVGKVEVSIDVGLTWTVAKVTSRRAFEWQRWTVRLWLDNGEYEIMARARSETGLAQPLSGRRNHVHRVMFQVQNHGSNE